MCGVIVVDAGRIRSTWYGCDAYIHDRCLRYCHIMRFSINCSAVICSPTIIFSILREASSETYGPRVYFPSYKFPIYYFAIFYFLIYKPKTQKYLLYHLFSFIYLYQISPLQVTVKGLTTPLSCWVQVVWLFVQVFGDLCVVSYYLGSQLREIHISTLLHHPFLFMGKTNASSRSSRRRPGWAARLN